MDFIPTVDKESFKPTLSKIPADPNYPSESLKPFQTITQTPQYDPMTKFSHNSYQNISNPTICDLATTPVIYESFTPDQIYSKLEFLPGHMKNDHDKEDFK